MSQEIKDAPLVDAKCKCETCKREPRVYRMNTDCSNCGEKYITEFRFGDETNMGIDCPHCGVYRRAIFGTKVSDVEKT